MERFNGVSMFGTNGGDAAAATDSNQEGVLKYTQLSKAMLPARLRCLSVVFISPPLEGMWIQPMLVFTSVSAMDTLVLFLA